LSYLRVKVFATLLEEFTFLLLLIVFLVLKVTGFLLLEVNEYPY